MNDVRLIDRVMKFGNSDVRNIPNSNRLKQNKPLILNEIRKMDNEMGKGPEKYLKFEFQLPDVNV